MARRIEAEKPKKEVKEVNLIGKYNRVNQTITLEIHMSLIDSLKGHTFKVVDIGPVTKTPSGADQISMQVERDD